MTFQFPFLQKVMRYALFKLSFFISFPAKGQNAFERFERVLANVCSAIELHQNRNEITCIISKQIATIKLNTDLLLY